jgi:hypothetical protein
MDGIAKAIEYMIIDALLAAESYMKIADQVDDPNKYVFLTDDIMPTIEKSTNPVCTTTVYFYMPHIPNKGALVLQPGTCQVSDNLRPDSYTGTLSDGRLQGVYLGKSRTLSSAHHARAYCSRCQDIV